MRRLFGRKGDAMPSTYDVLKQMDMSGENLTKKINELQTKIDNLLKEIKKPENQGRQQPMKKKVMELIKKKKRFESHQNSIESTKFNYEQLSFYKDMGDAFGVLAKGSADSAPEKSDIQVVYIKDWDAKLDSPQAREDVNSIVDILTGYAVVEDDGSLDADFQELEASLANHPTSMYDLDPPPTA